MGRDLVSMVLAGLGSRDAVEVRPEALASWGRARRVAARGPAGRCNCGSSATGATNLSPSQEQAGCFCVSTVDNTWWTAPCLGDGTTDTSWCIGSTIGARCLGSMTPFYDSYKGTWCCREPGSGGGCEF